MGIKIPPLPRYDPQNITGAKLAEIGRWALTGKQVLENKEESQIGYSSKQIEGDYTNIGWLDMRIEEICRKGKL